MQYFISNFRHGNKKIKNKNLNNLLSHIPPPDSSRSYSIDFCNLTLSLAMISIPLILVFLVSNAQINRIIRPICMVQSHAKALVKLISLEILLLEEPEDMAS